MAGPVITRIRERVRANHPLATALADGVRAAAARADTALQEADIPAVIEAVQTAIASNPTATASVNAERTIENRVRLGLIVVGIGAAVKFVKPELGEWFDQNIDLITTILIGLGATVAAIGEWSSKWLAGVNWRRPWTLLGIGR